MKRKMPNIPANVVLFSLSVLLLLPISAMAEGDGGWTTAASPGHIFQIEEDLHNNKKHLVMTVLKADGTHEVHWGPASGSVNSTYLLESMNGDSDMIATWQFDSVTQATVTVESCSTNCLWQSGQVVTLNKFFGDMKADAKIASRVPKTGQTECWDVYAGLIDCKGTGQDGEYQLGVLPAVPPSSGNPYTVHGWTGSRFTDNLDGTVTDNLTGLVWLKNGNCTDTVGGVAKTDGYLSWENALAWSNALASGPCGLTDGSSAGDWRLPNFNEMHSLIDPTQQGPALPAGYPFSGVQNSYYWTSTPDLGSIVLTAWIVNTLKDEPLPWFVGPHGGRCYVWPVRSGN